MQDAEDEGKVHAGHQGPTRAEGSVLTYVTEPESRKQRSRSPSCNSLQRGNPISTTNKVKRSGNWHCDGYFLVHLWNVKFKYQ